MSLYNILHGVNPATFFIAPMLGRHPEEWPRFRDCFIGEAKKTIEIYTRMGGNNGDCWAWSETDYPKNENGECTCPACILDKELEFNPYFLSRHDDDFDNTYCTLVFKVPEKWQEDFVLIIEGKFKEISNEYKDELYKIFPKLKDKFDEIFK